MADKQADEAKRREPGKQPRRPRPSLLERIQPDAAGVDCGEQSHFAARTPRCKSLPRSASTCVAGLVQSTLLPGLRWHPITKFPADACLAPELHHPPIERQLCCAAAP